MTTSDPTGRTEQEHRQELFRLEDLPPEIQQQYPQGTVFSPVYDGGRVVLQEVKIR